MGAISFNADAAGNPYKFKAFFKYLIVSEVISYKPFLVSTRMCKAIYRNPNNKHIFVYCKILQKRFILF